MKPEYIPVLLSFATFLGTLGVVGVGLLYNNSRLTDLRSQIDALSNHVDARINALSGHVDARINALSGHMDTRMSSVEARLDLLTGKVMELSDRMARVEERLGMK